MTSATSLPASFPGGRQTQLAEQVVAQGLGQRHQAILAALALADTQHAAVEVEVAWPQADDLGDAQAGGVSQTEQQAIASRRYSVEETLDFVAAEDGG